MLIAYYRGLGIRAQRITSAVRSRLGGPKIQRYLTIIVAGVWIGGVVARYEYGEIMHNPRHYIISDARQLTDTAERMLASPSSQEIYDTVWPPGTPAVLAILLARDGSLSTAGLLLILLSCLVPLIVGHTAFLIGGRGMALIAVALSSLHFGFIHYAGFFLAEELFQFAVATAIWISVAALVLDELVVSRQPSHARKITNRLLLGTGPGVAWALAASFRPNALPIAVGIGGALGLYWLRQHRRGPMWLLAGSILGLTIMIVPLAHRCSTLKHGFCVVSTNGAMNVALGQLDHAAGIEFFDPKEPYLNTGWWPPALAQHGYEGTIRLPFTMYDDGRIWGWIRHKAVEDPVGIVVRAARNVVDLFRFSYWPDSPALPRWFVVFSTVFIFVLVIVPGISELWPIVSWIRDGGEGSCLPIVLISIVIGVGVVTAIALGEPRYRFPFDCAFIVLAAMMFCGTVPGARPTIGIRTSRILPVVVGLVAVLALASCLLIAMVSSQGTRFAERFRPIKEPMLSSLPVDVRRADEFGRPFAAGTAWNAPGVYRFSCSVKCRELRLTFAKTNYSRAAEVSVDDNDRYRVIVYRGGQALGHVDIPRGYGGAGLRVVRLDLPPNATAGFDTLGIVPLYGDGIYVFGHLRLMW